MPTDNVQSGRRRFGRTILEVAPRVMRLETHRLARLPTSLTHRQFRILMRVGEGVTSPTEISRRANISLAAISESVDTLVKRGLLDRRPDTADRRASQLGLTPEGHRALGDAEEAIDELASELAADVTPERMAATLDVLAQVAENVGSRHQQLDTDGRTVR